MSISFLSPLTSAPPTYRAVASRGTLLLDSAAGVVVSGTAAGQGLSVESAVETDVSRPEWSRWPLRGASSAGGGNQSTSDLEALIAAAKRKVQPQVGVAGAEKVVGSDGSIDYKKLADLVAEQKALARPGNIVASSPILDLFA